MSSELISKILAGDVRSVSRALSLVENGELSESAALVRALYPHTANMFVLGVTGSPGAGKSTLVDQLARRFLDLGGKVGIVAVDPTSPFTGGAILGDRVRMQSLSTDPRVFIRSMATRGKLGGLCGGVNDALVVLSAAGYKTLLVETVGVGQDEVDIVRTADMTLVVLVPGMGDDIQVIKAGIMEIGDLFVVNKADRDGAARTRREVEALLGLVPSKGDWVPPVLEAVALKGEGIDGVMAAVSDFRTSTLNGGDRNERRMDAFRSRLIDLLRDRVVESILTRLPGGEVDAKAREVLTRRSDPYSVVEQWMRHLQDE